MPLYIHSRTELPSRKRTSFSFHGSVELAFLELPLFIQPTNIYQDYSVWVPLRSLTSPAS